VDDDVTETGRKRQALGGARLMGRDLGNKD
jgi:hypothetical protein